MPVEVLGPIHLCAQCHKPTTDTIKCARCGKVFCAEHSHLLALSHTGGMNIIQACEDCIVRDHLYVIDTNHPFYMKGKQNHDS